jgi:hypothetical protein
VRFEFLQTRTDFVQLWLAQLSETPKIVGFGKSRTAASQRIYERLDRRLRDAITEPNAVDMVGQSAPAPISVTASQDGGGHDDSPVAGTKALAAVWSAVEAATKLPA